MSMRAEAAASAGRMMSAWVPLPGPVLSWCGWGGRVVLQLDIEQLVEHLVEIGNAVHEIDYLHQRVKIGEVVESAGTMSREEVRERIIADTGVAHTGRSNA